MVFSIFNEMLDVSISDIGAELMSIKTKDKTEYLWQGNPKFWDGRAYNLFPIIGRLNQGVYIYNGQEFKMQLHGFLRTSKLEVINHQKSSITFELKYNNATLYQYPFKFLIRISYELVKNKINVKYNVVNLDDKPMYFNIGAHPGFNVPLKPRLNFDDYFVEFKDICKIKKHELNEDYCFMSGKVIDYELLNGRIIPLNHKMFEYDTYIFSDTSKTATLKSISDEKSVIINFPDFKYFAMWSNKTAPFVCLELWQGLPSSAYKIDDLQKKSDIITLEENKEYNNSWSIEIR
ncbi:MAG TPA: aldose 1-epimerase family protein [Clostridia bacterium]